MSHTSEPIVDTQSSPVVHQPMTNDAVCRWLPDTTLTYVNAPYCAQLGRSREELLGHAWMEFIPEETRPVLQETVTTLLTTQRPLTYEHTVERADGTTAWQQWTDFPILDAQGRVVEIHSVGVDITTRKQMEEEMMHLHRALAMHSATNRAILHATNEDALLQEICRIAVDLGHFTRAWVGLLQPDGQLDITWSACANELVPSPGITLAVTGPIHQAMTTGTAVVVSDLTAHGTALPWITLPGHTAAAVLLPLTSRYSTIGILGIYTENPKIFAEDATPLWQELAHDLTHGLEVLRTRLAHEQTRQHLRRRLRNEKIIATIAIRLITATDLPQAIRDALSEVGRLSGADAVVLFYFNEPAQCMERGFVWSAQPADPPGQEQYARISYDKFSWWSGQLRRGHVIELPNPTALPSEAQAERAWFTTLGITSQLAFPLYLDGAVGGFISFEHCTQTSLWDEDDQRFLHTAVTLIASAIERHRAEETQRTLLHEWQTTFDAINDAVALLDTEGRILRCNQAMQRTIRRPMDAIIGKTCRELVCLNSCAELECPLHRMLWSGKSEAETLQRGHQYFDARIDPLCDANGVIRGGVLVLWDMTERVYSERRILEYQQRLRSLVTQLSIAEEREQKALAQMLHEELGQSLALMKLRLDQLCLRAADTPEAASLQQVRELLVQGIQFTRSLTSEICPPCLYDLGLYAAAEWLADTFTQRHDLTVRVTGRRTSYPLSHDVRIMLFRGLRELLVNCVKHAQASEAHITFQRRGTRLSIIVEDMGVGFEPTDLEFGTAAEGKFGLFNLRERLASIDGALTIATSPGGGTRITMSVPLDTTPETE